MMATVDEVSRVLDALRRVYLKEAQRATMGLRRNEVERYWSRTYVAYHAILHDIPGDMLRASALHLGGESKWFPTAAELRHAVFALQERAQGIPTAQDAWAEVKRAFRRGFSIYRAPALEDWSHPLIAKALDAIGGWRTLCQSDNDAADRARFLQAYDVYVRREQEHMRMLPEVRQVVARLADKMRALPERADDARPLVSVETR